MAAPRWRREGDSLIDDRYWDEWVEFGWSELVAYLTKWAAFRRWEAAHPEQEETP